MKKKLNSLFFSTASLSVFTVIAALGLLFSSSVRYGYVFVDNALFENASFGFFVLSIITTAFLFLFLCLRIRGNEKTNSALLKVPALISEVFGILLVVYSIAAFATDSQATDTIISLFKQALPLWAAVVSILFFAFIFPVIKSGKAKKVISVLCVIVLAVVTYSSLFPIIPFKFTSGPAVIDNGEDGYSIIFATNDEGIGFVDYKLDGKDVRVYDNNSGRKTNSKIHSVTIPKDELSGTTYTVGATRVIDELSYGGRTGKTITGQPITFNDTFGDDINVLTVSDWHTENQRAEEACKKLGEDYQAVVLLGDCAPGLMSIETIDKYIVRFASDLTNGTMPIIYTRGNHETRGTAANLLAGVLKMDSFYFTTNIGKYNIVVLDSCEDKPDSHPEYGSMVDYESYRTNMVKWFEDLPEDETQNTVVFCHDKNICIEEDLSKAALEKIDAMNASLLVSGHEHIYSFDNKGNFPVLVDGGINANGNGTYVACMLKLSADGIKIDCVDNNGEKVVDENVVWKTVQSK